MFLAARACERKNADRRRGGVAYCLLYAMPTVFLNGRFCAADGAMVSAFDAGFQHGVGLFETMLASVSGGWRAGADSPVDYAFAESLLVFSQKPRKKMTMMAAAAIAG